MSRKNKSDFGAGATGSISFTPSQLAPRPSPQPAQSGPMRIAPPKSTSTLKYAQMHMAQNALRAAQAKPKAQVLPQSTSEYAGGLVTAVSPAVKKAVALLPQSASEYAGAPATAVSPAVKEAVTMVPNQSVSESARHASAMITPSSGGGGGGGGGVAWSPDAAGQPAAVYEETPDPQGEAKSAPQQADTESEPVMAWTPPDSRTAMVKVSAPVPVLATAEPPKGFFARIWEFFFGAKKAPAQKPLPSQLPAAKVAGELEDASEALVKRARYGDQNAMAILDLVGKNAKKGIPAAMKARDLIASYIRRNPVTSASNQAQVNGEDSVRRAATHIANGAPVTHARVQQTLSHFCSEAEKGAFLHGIRYPKQATPSQYGSKVELAHRAGKALALAGKIQNVRQPHSRISAFDPVVGWELGE